MIEKRSFVGESAADEGQNASRDKLSQLYEGSPLPVGELLFNLGLYTRSSLLVKFLVMSELYQRVLNIPGEIHEYGVWWGQNLVLLENLRAIYEPFNKQRVIVGFDSFQGYTHPLGSEDGVHASEVFDDETYSTGSDYKDYLGELLETHEGSNVLGHVKGIHRLIEGDVAKTAPQYFEDHPESFVALAYLDMGPYEPTKAALKALLPRLLPGSVLLMDQLTWSESPGEAIAFKEVFKEVNYTIEKCTLYPSKSIVTIQERP